MENKESAKYKTKNINTFSNEFFLALKNHKSANINSIRNLRLIATRVYSVCASGSFDCPFIKIRIVVNAIIEKPPHRITISVIGMFRFTAGARKYPVKIINTLSRTSLKMVLEITIQSVNHFKKSLIAV